MATAQVNASGIVHPTPEPHARSRGHGRTPPGSGFGLAPLTMAKPATDNGGCNQAPSFRHVDPVSTQGAF